MTDRCEWANGDPLYETYHDQEWGVPVHDDQQLFEMLVLDGAQAGLSWITILRKRDAYRAAFDNFVIEQVARYDEQRVDGLLTNAGIVRNRRKIESAVHNARIALEIQVKFGSLDTYLWRFVDGRPLQNAWRTAAELPAQTPLSQALSKDMVQQGFRFVGPTICYAFMQAVGMVNDHVVGCFRHRQLGGESGCRLS
jgi:DNA-3-methyladenine glycosylase I